MSQLKALVNVTNGSQVVIFPGTNVASQIKASHIFMVDGEYVPYWVAVDASYNGTDTVVVLSGAYAGTTASFTNGIVVTGATFPHNIPTIDQGDVGTAAVFTAAMYKIEEVLNTLSGMVGSNGVVLISTDNLPEGSTNQYFTASRARNAALTGLNTKSTGTVSSQDTILTAFSKVVAQLLAHVNVGGAGANTHPLAVPNGAAGFMSGTDKAKLDGLSGGSGGGNASLTVGPTAPSNPVHGQEWIDTNTGVRWTYVNDGNSSQWVNFA